MVAVAVFMQTIFARIGRLREVFQDINVSEQFHALGGFYELGCDGIHCLRRLRPRRTDYGHTSRKFEMYSHLKDVSRDVGPSLWQAPSDGRGGEKAKPYLFSDAAPAHALQKECRDLPDTPMPDYPHLSKESAEHELMSGEPAATALATDPRTVTQPAVPLYMLRHGQDPLGPWFLEAVMGWVDSFHRCQRRCSICRVERCVMRRHHPHSGGDTPYHICLQCVPDLAQRLRLFAATQTERHERRRARWAVGRSSPY